MMSIILELFSDITWVGDLDVAKPKCCGLVAIAHRWAMMLRSARRYMRRLWPTFFIIIVYITVVVVVFLFYFIFLFF